MSEYGIRLSEERGKQLTLTPNWTTVVSAGRATMPDTLEDDDTYGIDIDLPGIVAIPESDITVMITPSPSVNNVIYTQWDDSLLSLPANFYCTSFYMNSAATYYTRNVTTGVMTSWAAGDRTPDNIDDWNPILSVCPVAFWDKMGATTFTKVRLFAATAYMIKLPNAIDLNYAHEDGTATATVLNAQAPNVIDDNLSTGHDAVFEVYSGSDTINYQITVTWSTPRDITQVEIVYATGGYGYGNGKASYVDVYYNSAWHELAFAIDVGYENYALSGQTTWTLPIFNTGVTGIRLDTTLFAASYYHQWAGSRLFVYELRAKGVDDSGTPYTIKYSIGSAGVPTVDYAVSIKKWDY